MIPQLVTVRRRRSDGRWRRLYIPVVPVLLVLAPLLLLAALAGPFVCRGFRMNPVNPVSALGGVGRLLWALPGTRFDLDLGRTAVRISVR